MIKVTDLMNWKILLISIFSSAALQLAGGEEDIWAIKLYSGRMQIQKYEKLFQLMNDESRLFYLLSKTFSVK
jgi:hypothetical protein